MKKNIIFYTLVLLLGFFASCKKDDVVQTDSQVGISHITYYATITLKGDQYMSVVKGGTFTDPGATATAKGQPLTVTVTGSVNTAVAGMYILTYTAVNSDGFSASQTRTVAVLPSAEQPGVDLSGTYIYVATGGNPSTISKLAPGFYSTTNCWSGATTIPCLFICVDGTNITMPSQATAYGTLSGTGTLSPTGALTYTVTIPEQGLVNVKRNWQKQ